MFDKRIFFLIFSLISLSLRSQTNDSFPILTFDVDTADFGDVSEGDSVVYDFWFTNTGTSDLIIKQAWPACGCTHPDYTKGAIPPGGRGRIHVVFQSKGFGGQKLVKEVIIINNGAERYARFKVNVVNTAFKKELEQYKKEQEAAESKKSKKKKKVKKK